MKLVTPETWYRLYWTGMGIVGMVAFYFVIKHAVMAALLAVR